MLQFKLGADAIIVCPYHGWAYKLDGGLHAAREMDALESFDPADYGPNPPQLTAFHGLIFINCNDGADSFEPELTIVESPLGAYDLAHARVAEARTYQVSARWKLARSIVLQEIITRVCLGLLMSVTVILLGP